MRKQYLFLAFMSIMICGTNGSFAQLVGTNLFLQGRYLEIGQLNNGSFGACTSIAGYHPHSPGAAIGSPLAEVYDYGKDGWTVGTPPFMGDYTYPGSPFEGWELQIGANRTQAFQQCPGGVYYNGGAGIGLTGSNTGYSNVGGRVTGFWTGSASGGTVQIRKETRIDTLASAVIVTTVIRNTAATATAPMYYMRSCDPDNDQSWPGGGFFTNNTIVHQNEDARHRVLVASRGAGYPAQSYFALGTKDCRARCCIYDSWWLSSTIDLGTLWDYSMTGATYGLGQTRNGDIAIALTYRLGSIPAGDSTILSYAYIFDGNLGIDSAFPDPRIVVNGVPRVSYAPPTPNYDTFDVCLYPGMTTLPVNILNAVDRGWSWSRWTWSPGVGLASTTGVNNVINVAALPPMITYTITGTDSATGMFSCHNKTFYLTILTCNGAVSNSPCAGDTLWLNAPGDSTFATYQWYGPAPSTTVFSTTQRTFFYPATTAMNGVYAVIKTVPGGADTSFTTVTVNHKPTVVASSNAPLCIGAANTLSLTATVDSPVIGYSWTATPPPFVSSMPNPTIAGFSVADTGLYQVVVTSVHGCRDTSSVQVTLVPPPAPPIVTVVTPYCQNDGFVPFVVTGLVTGGSTLWYANATGGTGSVTAPVVNTTVPGLYTYYFSQIVGSCESLRDSVKVRVNPLPAPIGGATGVCQYFTTLLSNTSAPGTWASSNPSIATIGSTGLVTGVNPGTVVITYTLPTTCRRNTVVTVHPKPARPIVPEVRPCQFTSTTALTVSGTAGNTLTWYGLGVTAGSPIPPLPNTDTTAGVYTYYVQQTTPFGCISDSAVYPVRIVPQPAAPDARDTSYCQYFNAPALTADGDSLRWYNTPTGVPGSWVAPVPSTLYPGVTTYYVTQTVNTCESPRADMDVTILYLPDFKIKAERTWVCQYDSLRMEYDGPVLVDPAYNWQLPLGASFIGGTSATDENIYVKFDTAVGKHFVYLTASNYQGQCATTDTIEIKVVPAPSSQAYINPNVCLGDTITLALSDRTSNADKFLWLIDGLPILGNPVVDIITSNSHTGGPFVISWNDTGIHIITVQGATAEGCRALPTGDTVRVHALPDPRFKILPLPNRPLCIEDSVFFSANVQNYGYNYKWEPEHSFVNENRPEIWGRVEELRSMITLTVTTPFGCKASYSQQIKPEECCTVSFPNAFTPNGDDKNDCFRPMFTGYKRFQMFRVTNRWGQTVFESTNSNPKWDGMYNGVKQDLGVYYYYLRYDCGGKTLEVKGDVTLIR